MSRFYNIDVAPTVEPFAVTRDYQQDTHDKKVNLGTGVYRTESCQPWVLPCVKKAEEILAADDTQDHEYLPPFGYGSFPEIATKLLLGDDCDKLTQGNVFGIQCLSGTGSLRIAAEFLIRILKYNTVYVSAPSWENHKLLLKLAGFEDIREYRYWNAKTRGLHFDGLLEDFRNAPPNSVVILHACAHNPTGCDPTKEQWKLIADIIEKKKLFPLFDSAYQGFATGDVDDDAWAVRHFVNRGLELMCAQSFAKNFGLYGERTGNLTVVVNDKAVLESVKSQFTILLRGMYSTPPAHGAKIVSLVLSSPSLTSEWKTCIKIMSGRIKEMRIALRDKLLARGTPGNWDHIVNQIGMFSYTGLTTYQVNHLNKKYHIYLFRSGRISMCGLNKDNLDYVADAICDAVKCFPQDSKY